MDKEEIKVIIDKSNCNEINSLVQSFGLDKYYIFEFQNSKGVKMDEAVLYIKKAIKGLKRYQIKNIPKCLLSDQKVVNPVNDDKYKPTVCRKCIYDNECGGVYKDIPAFRDIIEKISPVSSNKDRLIEYVSKKSSKDDNKLHSLGLLNATTVCNLNCIFCNEAELRKNAEHTEFSVIVDTIKELKKRGVTSINFMGGEITTRPDILELLDFVRSLSLQVGIATNCIKFADKEFCREVVSRIDFMEVSIHAATRKTYSRMYGRDVFDTFLRSIDNLSAINSEYARAIIVNTLIGAYNHKELEDIVVLVLKNFSKEKSAMHFRLIEREGAAKDNPECMVSFIQARDFLYRALELAKQNKLSVKVDSIPACLLRGYEEYSRAILESTQKLNQYYFNKMKLTDGLDYTKRFNKHLVFEPGFEACRECIFNFVCRGISASEFVDRDSLIKELKPIKSGAVEILERAKDNLIITYEI